MPPSTAGRFALVKLTGDAVAMTDEAMATTDDQTYQIVDTLKTVFDPATELTVKADGVEVDAEVDPYVVNRLTGQVIFDDNDAGRGDVTVSGDYRPLSVVAKAKYFTVKIGEPPIDATTFDSPGWEESIPNINSVSGSLRRNRELGETSDFFFDAIDEGASFVLEFWLDRRKDFAIRCWAVCTANNANAATDSVVDGDVEFRGSQDADRRVASVALTDTTAPAYLFPTSIVFDQDPASATLTVAAPTTTPTVEVLDQNGDELVGAPTPTSWFSSNTAIATVNTSTGLVTRVANGHCRIHAVYGAVVSPLFRITCTA